MCQVLKRIVPQPVPSDFSASEYVAGDIMAYQLFSAVWVFHGFEELIFEIVVPCTCVLFISTSLSGPNYVLVTCYVFQSYLVYQYGRSFVRLSKWYVIIFISGGQALEVRTKNFAPLLRSFATGSTRAAEAHQIQCMIAHPDLHLELRFVHLSRLTVMYFKIFIFGVLLISLMWWLINFLLRFSIIGETKSFHCWNLICLLVFDS